MDWTNILADFIGILIAGTVGFVVSSYSRGKEAGKREDRVATHALRIDVVEINLEKHIVASLSAMEKLGSSTEAAIAKHVAFTEAALMRMERDVRGNETTVARLDAKLDAIKETLEQLRLDQKQMLREGCNNPKCPARKST